MRKMGWSEKPSIRFSEHNLERIAQLVEQNGCSSMSGEVLTLLKWMETVDLIFQPSLVVIQKAGSYHSGRIEQAEQAFQIAERLV